MTDNFDCVMLMPGNEASNGAPVITKPENLDTWPSEKITQQATEAVCEIINRGYQGIKVEHYPLADGRSVNNFLINEQTPEGRLVSDVMAFARQGRALPTAEVISILERIYREQGLAIPQKTKGQRANAGPTT